MFTLGTRLQKTEHFQNKKKYIFEHFSDRTLPKSLKKHHFTFGKQLIDLYCLKLFILKLFLTIIN